MLVKMYRWVKCPVCRVSIREAEIQKLIHNAFNAGKISFYNEMRILCSTLGLDPGNIFPLVAKSAEGSWNPEYGIKDLGPFQGACLPKDAGALLKFASETLDVDLKILSAIIDVNESIKDKQ
jgi:UDPglucose 6-dehydrogenase